MSDILLVRNGRLILPEEVLDADLLAVDGLIVAIGVRLDAPPGATVIDAAGRDVLPGVVDPHVHFGLRVGDLTSADDFASGTAAAARGGVTCVIDYLDPAPGDRLEAAFARRRAEMEGKLRVDAGLHGVLTDWTPATRAAVKALMGEGIPSFKVFLVYSQRIDDPTLLAALDASAELGFVVCAHCESAPLLSRGLAAAGDDPRGLAMLPHRTSRPPEVEIEAVERACRFATATSGRLHVVHVSCGESAAALGRARRGASADVSGETCPHYLFLDESVFDTDEGRFFATCPQVKRRDVDGERLLRALETGELQMLATDHCAWSVQQKDAWEGDFRKVPYGIPGVETLLPLAYTRLHRADLRFSLPALTRLLSLHPARRFGLARKGALLPGFDADLVILDPAHEETVPPESPNTPGVRQPFAGARLRGFPDLTLVRGKIVHERGRGLNGPPVGRFAQREICLSI